MMQNEHIPNHRIDILLIIFSATGMLGLAGRGIYSMIVGFSPKNPTTNTSLTSALFDAISMFFCAALLAPLLVYSIRRLKNKQIPRASLPPIKFWQVAVLAALFLLTVVLASALMTLAGSWWVAALPFFVLGIALPVAGLIWIAIGGLPTGSWRRVWAALGIGMVGSTMVAMLLEYALVGVAAVAAGVVASVNTAWLKTFQQIKDQVTRGGDIQSLLTQLAPSLTNPLFLLLALAFASFIAPIIEETLKPLAVLLIGKRLHSPAEGFLLGAICGAGFALLEGMLAAGGSPEMLGIGLAGRAASSLMHLTASGLIGWGIASAYLEKRWWRMIGTYVLSISIHGFWNGSIVLAVFGALRLSLQETGYDVLGLFLVVAGIGILGAMLVTIMVLLPIINRRFRTNPSINKPATQSDIIAPL
jgi:RsiW-degrading membrane proteinase PrsW (M82 family)